MRKLSESGERSGIDSALLARADKRAWFHRYPRGWPFLLFFITSVFTVASVMAIERADRQTREIELDRNATEIASGLQRRASENIALLRAGAALFASRDRVSLDTFTEFATGLYGHGELHGAMGIGWARLLPAADVPAFELEMRERERPDYLVHPRPEAGQRLSAPIMYLMPMSDAKRIVIGYDMYSEPIRTAALNKALRIDQPVASGRLQLIQDLANPDTPASDTSGLDEPSFVIYMPVYRMEGGRRVAKGFVFSPFHAGEFLSSAAELYRNRQVEIAIYDGLREPDHLLAWRAVPGETGAVLDRHITIAGREWILHVSTKRPAVLTQLSKVTLFFGLIIGLLIMYTARLITRRAAEDRQVLEALTRQASIRTSLTRELNHRVKNTLANVLSIVSLTRRRATNIDEFTETLAARLRALSATHDLLSHSDWTDAPIDDIVRSELAPYIQGSESQVEISGPPINLAPNDALSLGLAVHELATNAAKYGALSSAEGRITIGWRQLTPDLAEVHWREEGGPEVTAPSKRGFGRDLIEKIVAHELRSEVDLQFRREGVECRVQVPIRRAVEFSLRRRPGD